MKKILVIQTASIGDVILATALVETLHAAFPEANIDFLVKKGNESLFENHPFLGEVYIWNKKVKKHPGLFTIIGRIRHRHYDLVVNVQRFFSSGFITALSGAKATRGFKKNPLSWLFTTRFPHNIGRGVHEVERNHTLIADLTTTKPGQPRLYPSSADAEFARGMASVNCYTISPASLWFTKQYPAAKWVELIRLIPQDAKVFLLGAPGDHKLCEQIIRDSGHPRLKNFAGKLTFLQSAALMQACTMNYTNDSAPMHLASAVNAPVTAVFCSTIPGFGFGPLSDNSATVEMDTQLNCRPCGLHGLSNCPEKHFRCALEIDTDKLAGRLGIPCINPVS